MLRRKTVSVCAAVAATVAASQLSAADLQWRGGTGASQYWLTIGSAPGFVDIASLNAEGGLSAFVADLPSDGRRIYVRLYSLVDGSWQFREYVLTAVNVGR